MGDDQRFDADALLNLPRLSGLTVSPDGHRLVTTVSRLDKARKKYVSALWEIDVTGTTPPRRLTRKSVV